MAVQHANSVLVFNGNGSNAEAYPISFRFLSNTEVKVAIKAPTLQEPTVLTEGEDYTLTIFRDNNNVIMGGEVLTDLVYDAPTLVFVYRQVDLTQLTELPEFGPFPANALEMSLDKAVMALQQQDRAIKRCFRVTDFSTELTAPYPIPNTVLGISASNDLRLFDGSELLSLIQLPGSLVNAPTTYWLNDFDRSLKVPDFVGQIGLQMDDHALYHSTGSEVGDWTPMILDEDGLSSNHEKMPPSQASVKAYVESVKNDLEEYADNSVAALLTSILSELVPTGSVQSYAGSAAPTGWVLCHGQAVSRSTYANLYTVIGNTYGSGDGSATFNLPDLRGRVVAGKDDMGGASANRLTNTGVGNPGINGAELGAAGGGDRHQLTEGEMPSHTHDVSNGSFARLGLPQQIIITGNATGNGSLVVPTTESRGGSEAHPNMPPAIILNYLIKY